MPPVIKKAPYIIEKVGRNTWPDFDINWREWRIIDYVAQQGGVAKREDTVKAVQKANFNNDEMGTTTKWSAYRRARGLVKQGILNELVKKTPGGGEVVYYRIKWPPPPPESEPKKPEERPPPGILY